MTKLALRYLPAAFLFLAGCFPGDRSEPLTPPVGDHCRGIELQAASGRIPPETSQLLLVTAPPGDSAARVVACEKRDGRWADVLAPLPATIGRNGFADPGGKKEGDGKTPSGIFGLQTAFGYAPTAPTGMPYRQATAEDLWVDDTEAPDYNRWVRRGETIAASYEAMRREDDLYKYGLVIEYNTRPVVRGAGSAIFFHLWRGAGQPTEGCIAMAEPDLLAILGWLDPAKQPLTLLSREETVWELSTL